VTDDPKRLWQDQTKEGPDMGLQQVRVRLRRYETRMSRSRIVAAVLGGGATALAAYLAVTAPLSVLRGGQALLAAGLAVLFWQSWRGLVQAPRSDDVAACAAFLRTRLVARRGATRREAAGSGAWRRSCPGWP
jgi:hypothetical protein